MSKKYYVVWTGKRTGVFASWDECKQQVHGFKGAQYKSYRSKEEAEEAFHLGPEKALKNTKRPAQPKQASVFKKPKTNYIKESISVDAACSGNPGKMEYQGVHTGSGEQLFHYGPVPKGTNNIGEFLAIVHALAYLKQKESSLPVYSDSRTAMSWVQKKRANSSLVQDESTARIWRVIHRAEKWLQEHSYANEILKWETDLWGESKADFGRK